MSDKINRKRLVERHNIKTTEKTGVIPIGNGEMCFSADATGLQTSCGNTMSHWGFHSFEKPEGELPETGCYMNGRLQGNGTDIVPEEFSEQGKYMFENPHIFNLLRLRFKNIDIDKISQTSRCHDLYSGILTSEFTFDNQKISVVTAVHPHIDAVAVKISTPLEVVLDFPYPSLGTNIWSGDFNSPDRHTTQANDGGTIAGTSFLRIADSTRYYAAISSAAVKTGEHEFLIKADEFVCVCSASPIERIPSFDETKQSSIKHWNDFWENGGALDLSKSSDKRWFELERRIVLSQYLLAVQTGSYPSSEAGLMNSDPWHGQFHMEMMWWHLAHYALWNRFDMAEKAISCYQSFLPVAKKLAAQLNYKGAKWGKMVGPEGRTAPWKGNSALLWKQPHPIYFAELEYKLKPTAQTIDKWKEIVYETALHMADYVTRDEKGIYHLSPSMPPSEIGFSYDTVFDLAYFRWGLDTAQTWLERSGEKRISEWDDICNKLAPLPQFDGVYIRSPEWTDTYTQKAYEHPDMVGIYGMLPLLSCVDKEVSRNTLKKICETWDFEHIWGWDCSWMAMNAVRLHEKDIAVDIMLKEKIDFIGASSMGCYPYLPSNGGMLFAFALMAVSNAFTDGFVVEYENLTDPFAE